MFCLGFKDRRQLYYNSFRLVENREEEFDNSREVKDNWDIGPGEGKVTGFDRRYTPRKFGDLQIGK